MLVFLVLLACAAYYDWRFKAIPDLINAALWGWAILQPSGQFFAVVGFGCAYLLNSAIVFLYRHPYHLWGDILMLGPYVMYVSLFAVGYYDWYFGFTGVGIPLVIGAWKKKPQPLAPWLLGACLTIALLAFV